MTLEQLKFLAELLATPGIALTRERWKVAVETDAAIATEITRLSKPALATGNVVAMGDFDVPPQ